MRAARPVVVALLLATALGAMGARAADASGATGDAARDPRHDESHVGAGFVRLAPGVAHVSNRVEQGADHLAITGAGFELEVAIGRVVRPHLALHATAFGSWVAGPQVDMHLTGIASGSGEVRGHAALGAIGGGVTRDGLPAALYVSASAGAGRFTLTTDEAGRHRSAPGLVLEVVAGRELPVTREWGVGMAGAWVHGSLPDHELVHNWTGNTFALRLSATYRGAVR